MYHQKMCWLKVRCVPATQSKSEPIERLSTVACVSVLTSPVRTATASDRCGVTFVVQLLQEEYRIELQ